MPAAAAAGSHAAVPADLAGAAMQIGQLTAENTALRASLEDLNAELDGMQAQVTAAAAELSAAREQVTTITAERDTARQAVEAVTAQFTAEQAAFAEFRATAPDRAAAAARDTLASMGQPPEALPAGDSGGISAGRTPMPANPSPADHLRAHREALAAEALRKASQGQN